ncbi:MAG TPA: amidohydrolase family protein [Tenuifilaceae bacterium]|nr:amidohydrolase family protein [Tenuifilaceae bacterium]
MKRINIYSALTVSLLVVSFGCHKPKPYDLIVENAIIFETTEGKASPALKTILINADTIAGIVDYETPVRTKKVVDADGRLVTPGNIDTHVCLQNVIEGSKNPQSSYPKVLTNYYRNNFSRRYLPYGITTALDLEPNDSWTSQILDWTHNPKFTTLLVAYQLPKVSFISSNRPTTPNIDSIAKALQSKGLGYVFLDEQEAVFPQKVYEMLKGKGMVVFTRPHFGTFLRDSSKNIVSISTLISNALHYISKQNDLSRQIKNVYGSIDTFPKELFILEAFKYMVENEPALLDKIAQEFGNRKATISSDLYGMAEFAGLTPERNLSLTLPRELQHRAEYNFNHLLSYVKKLHDMGVKLLIGTNSPLGGLAYETEQMLLSEAGIPASDVLVISTLNAAEALGISSKTGCIKVGSKADLIIYDMNPLEEPSNFTCTRRVINGGKLYKRNSQKTEESEL